MQSDQKLKEAQYFLGKLNLGLDFEELAYNLSAFVSAWRSVFDVLLYDYAETYFNVNREEKIYITRTTFQMVAKATRNHDAEKFIAWYNKRLGVVHKHELRSVRNFLIHKGSLVREIYVPVDIASSTTATYRVPPDVDTLILSRDRRLIAVSLDVPQILKKCNNGFALMKKIVEEAKDKFK